MRNNIYTVDVINNHMNLRLPQYKALQILDDIKRSMDFGQSNSELQKMINEKYPIFRDFERDFPSLTFALATGVGKTVLMGAFITYLYTNHDIKNFFIVAPNLTIYNKLIQDFGNPNFQKYVFQRLNVFLQNPPLIVTGDTYKDIAAGQQSIKQSITINIFNIGKINAEVRGGKEPQVKRPWEVLGQSYFDYLVGLKDLVVLMDESHHYRADRGMTVINELKPLLGLELTATPQVETSKGAQKFRNVVYEYSLAHAITDGFVKEPAAATRKNFDKAKFNPHEIDEIKLTDGIRIHRNTQAELEAYAENHGVKTVKPFVLVVCKDTTHAAEILEFVSSNDFYDGYYADKVIELHSNQKGSEKDENIQQLLTLEHENNKIEIVIHVNMLKEGWDVTNLYTIIPLRTAASLTLREQTLGRGLRLPYGRRTGNPAVDRVTIVAHDKFEEIINAANEETSIIKQENIILIEDDEDLGKDKEKVRPKTQIDDFISQMEKKKQYARSVEEKQEIDDEIQYSRAVGEAIVEILSTPINISVPVDAEKQTSAEKPQAEQKKIISQLITTKDLNKPEVKKIIHEKAKLNLEKDGQLSLDFKNIDKKIDNAIAPLVEQKIKFNIDIPDIAIVQVNQQIKVYKDFDLDTSYGFNFGVPNDEIIIESLKTSEITRLNDDSSITLTDTTANTIVLEILNIAAGIDYGTYGTLLIKLANQAIDHISKGRAEQEIEKIVFHYKKDVANRILEHMSQNSELSPPEYAVKLYRSSTPILQQDYTKFKEDDIVKYTANIPADEIRKKVVGYFAKACHTAYKFDSVPEHTFSIVLERSDNVLRWMRPAPQQFKIYYGSRQYQPDFVVETTDFIYIVEVKAKNRINDEEVKQKAKAAKEYCNNVNTLFAETDKKLWKYILILDNKPTRHTDFDYLENEAER